MRTADSGFLPLDEEPPDPPVAVVRWADRRARLVLPAPDAEAARARWAALWGADPPLALLDAADRARLSGAFEPVRLEPGRAFVEQGERGDYLGVMLDGRLRVERAQPGGGRLRLADPQPGDPVGEMALLDAGERIATATALTPCTLAVLEAGRLEALLRDEPRLAAALLGCLSRRLSLRVRQLSVRLAALSSTP